MSHPPPILPPPFPPPGVDPLLDAARLGESTLADAEQRTFLGHAIGWNIGTCLAGLGVWVGVQILLAIVLAIGAVLLGRADELEAFLSTQSLELVVASVLASWTALLGWPWIVSRGKGTGRFFADMGLSITGMDALVGLACYLTFLALSYAGTLGFELVTDGGTPPDNSGAVEGVASGPLAIGVLFFVVAIGTPIAEEVFFRGLLLRGFGARWGPGAGILVSGAVFGGLHFQFGGIGDLWFVGLLTIYGIMLAWVTVFRGGRLGAAIAAHALNNGVAVLLLIQTDPVGKYVGALIVG